jgi:hypothetical protein
LITGITDNSTATYAKSNYIGRPDSVHVYQNRTRNISFNIKVLATNRTELPIIWKKVDAMKGLTQPTFKPFFFESSTSTNSTAEEFKTPSDQPTDTTELSGRERRRARRAARRNARIDNRIERNNSRIERLENRRP